MVTREMLVWGNPNAPGLLAVVEWLTSEPLFRLASISSHRLNDSRLRDCVGSIHSAFAIQESVGTEEPT